MRGTTAGLGLALLVVLTAFSTAALAIGIHLPGTQPTDGDGDPDFPEFANGTKEGAFDDPGNCGSCHGGYRSQGEPIYEPYDSWSGSMMANATRDPLFAAALDIANQDDADVLGDAGVGDFCIRCHSPKAWYEGRSDAVNAWGEPFDGSSFVGSLSQENNDFEGLVCHFCHRMYDASDAPAGEFSDANAPYEENGEVYLDKTEKVMRGPYSDAQPPGRHDFEMEPMHRTSVLCGQCHNVTNPALNRLDAETGADLGYLMPVERTYDEWRQSDFSDTGSEHFAECQNCHMEPPDLDGDGTTDPAFACANPPGPRGENTALEGPIFTHFFRGGGTWMMELLKGEYGAVLGRTEAFDASIASSMRLLQEETATLDLSVPASASAGSPMDVDVRVTNLSGHKFPTGYPEGRRAWIRLASGPDTDADGTLDASEITYESGAYDAATGVLTEDADAKIYEIKVGRWNYNGDNHCDVVDDVTGKKLFHFVLNDCVKRDNRIPPRGFVPNVETEPVDYTYPDNPDQPGTLAYWDDTHYDVSVPASASAEMLVDVTVYYQTASKEFIDFLLEKNRSTCDPFDAGCDPTQPNAGQNRGEKMYDLWQAYGRSAPVVIAHGVASVPVVAGGGPAGEASDPRDTSDQMLVTAYDDQSGELTVSYAPACDAADHAVYWGDLSLVSSYAYSGASCSLGTSGSASFTPDVTSAFFLLVGHDGSTEGWYGLDWEGLQRPESSGLPECDLPRDLGQTCMP